MTALRPTPTINPPRPIPATMEVAVIGAGALGSLFGGLLADDGHDVWLLHHRPAVAEAIEADGVVVEEVDGTTRRIEIRAAVDAARVGPADVALVLVKSHQTLVAVDQHEACIGPGTRVLSLQNGLTNHHRLRDHLGAVRTLHGVTYQGVSATGPGRISRTDPGRTVLGGEDAEFAARLANAFESAGLETDVVSDPFRAIWKKQLWGAAIKPLAALTGLPNRGLIDDEGLAGLMHRLMRETAAVAAARGQGLDADATFEQLTRSLAGSGHTSSMLQDVGAGRRTEIEDVNGAIVALGAEAGVDVPANEVVTALVRGLERGYLDGD